MPLFRTQPTPTTRQRQPVEVLVIGDGLDVDWYIRSIIHMFSNYDVSTLDTVERIGPDRFIIKPLAHWKE